MTTALGFFQLPHMVKLFISSALSVRRGGVLLGFRTGASSCAAAAVCLAGADKQDTDGDDAVARKRSRVRWKRLRNSENAVSARVAAIIASKRRICEGMCFSLPTPDDPFNERHGKKHKRDEPTEDTAAAEDDPKKKKKDSNNTKKPPPEKDAAKSKSKAIPKRETGKEEDRVEYDRPSKFLVVCLNAIRDAVASEGGGGIHDTVSWGLELWKCCSAASPSDVLDTSGEYATREQTAWLVSTACDIVARKEKLGVVVSCPFLLYLVPSQEKAVQVRSICKPLKSLGIHSVSLHSGAFIEHQMSGLKSCEPEFLISTPGRLLELVSLKAIDISSVSMLVIDGLKCFMDLNISDKLCSIRNAILSDPQITIFSDPFVQSATMVTRNLLRRRITKLTINDSVTSRSAFMAQYVHFCPSKEKKTSKVKEILEHVLNNHGRKTAKVLLVAANDHEAQNLSSSLKLENCTVTDDDSHGSSFTICSSVGLINVLVKDQDSMAMAEVEEFEIVLVVDLPPSVDEYVEILTGAARHAVVGEVHSIFSNTDAPLAEPLAEVLANCGQVVPEFLKTLESS